MTIAPYEIRPIDKTGYDPFVVSLERAFGWDPPTGRLAELFDAAFSAQRLIGVFDGDDVVGTAGALSMTTTVPGSQRPCAGVTTVSVTSTHRRRGLLTALMRRQLDDIAAAGVEAVAALWASEPQLYQQYGYGLAGWNSRLDVETPWSAFSRAGQAVLERFRGRLHLREPAKARPDMERVYERVTATAPGAMSRDRERWDLLLADLPEQRAGGSEMQVVVAEVDGDAVGYASFRIAQGSTTWSSSDGELRLVELLAETPEVHAALWRHVLDTSLVRRLTARIRPHPDPLLLLLADPRHARAALLDGVWLRLVDLPRALSERTYSAPTAVTLRVHDAFLPANDGTWRVEIDDMGAATVTPTGTEPDLELTAADLGAAHLGGTTLASLAAAGRVIEHSPGTLLAASRAWSWHEAPYTVDIF